MRLVNKTMVSRLALSLSLSVISAACLASVLSLDVQPSLAQDAAGSKSMQPSLAQDATWAKSTPLLIAQSETGTTSEDGQAAVRKMTIVVPAKNVSGDGKSYEEQLKAEAMTAESRQNEAVQHFDASRVYFSGGNSEMAELELQAAIMDSPDIKAFHRDYCLLSILRGHPMRALAEAMMVVGLGDPIPLSDKQVEKLRDRGCKLHYRRGLELEQKQKWKDAITEFQWALEYRPNNAKVMRSMAFANASSGNIELAEKQYGSSFSADPAEAYGHADFAYLLAETGKGGEALKQLEEAVKLQPKVAALHIDLGWMAESKGDLGEAEGEFATAVKLSPKHASLWTHLGKLLARQGKAEQAAEAYKTALALDPEATDAQHGLDSLKLPATKPSTSTAPHASSAPHSSAAPRSETTEEGQVGQNGGASHTLPKFIKKDA